MKVLSAASTLPTAYSTLTTLALDLNSEPSSYDTETEWNQKDYCSKSTLILQKWSSLIPILWSANKYMVQTQLFSLNKQTKFTGGEINK